MQLQDASTLFITNVHFMFNKYLMLIVSQTPVPSLQNFPLKSVQRLNKLYGFFCTQSNSLKSCALCTGQKFTVSSKAERDTHMVWTSSYGRSFSKGHPSSSQSKQSKSQSQRISATEVRMPKTDAEIRRNQAVPERNRLFEEPHWFAAHVWDISGSIKTQWLAS